MFIVIAGGKLSNLTVCDVGDEDVHATIVVEPSHPSAIVGLVEITSDDHRIPRGFPGLGSWRCGYKSDAFPVGRPGYPPAGGGKRAIGALHLSNRFFAGAVPLHNPQARLSASLVRQP